MLSSCVSSSDGYSRKIGLAAIYGLDDNWRCVTAASQHKEMAVHRTNKALEV
ncbi:hypothetical protein F441_20090 [Phytophthora nicotianae CJ01A1]|uniref:Uncharacterized protein n=4 Tax=Phytophthora nicotianae TaxID=4792 RepID=W2Y7L4_PHYNI|nr:hypothetical protein L915_19657 [Phytophthora nicotianae]ETO61835.1 hypothetical protein F444_20225 [Phytophthora nicotianae P1976]ETP02910.1 hypothetical protein F441_20090 [Phytophthora nicotianae CJ01A1]ETP31095.1 hypothetical protein F442_20029 [Phytophthora nicotianae P10297]ETL26860.1 hypothetical protein L916_19545 [Phytophthora nicotianae]